MATNVSFVEYLTDQAHLGARLAYKRMFGEYALYLDGKVVALVCDDSLFVKPVPATRQLAQSLPQRPPYPGAKPHVVADAWLDEPERLRTLLLAVGEAVPESRTGKKRASKRPGRRADT